MTINDFLDNLYTVRKDFKWFLARDTYNGVRSWSCNKIHCPLTAVYKGLTGDYMKTVEWKEIARKLEMKEEDAKMIVTSADSDAELPENLQRLRKDIISTIFAK